MNDRLYRNMYKQLPYESGKDRINATVYCILHYRIIRSDKG